MAMTKAERRAGKPIDNISRRDMTAAVQRVTQRSFCTSCQSDMPTGAGRMHIQANGRRRFICATCAAHQVARV